jgi:hypothetical protein
MNFQSIYRSLDVQIGPKKVVSFKNYVLATNDVEIAERLRKLSKAAEDKGRAVNFWEAPDGKIEDEVESPRPRRGRPPKVIQGVRSVDETKENEE